MAKKKKLRIKNILLLLISLVLIGGIFYSGKYLFTRTIAIIIEKTTDAYIGSTSPSVQLYNMDYTEAEKVVRGTKVTLYDKDIIKEGENEDSVTYKKIRYDKENYLITPDNIVSKYEDAVMETTKYVRTSATVYVESDTADIKGYLKKGTALEITGFDTLNKDGTVNMYKVKSGDMEGYVYSKYLVDTQELANANYDQDGIYQIHAARPDNLGGGSAANLDYYPYEKPAFKDNVMPTYAKAIYMNAGVVNNVDAYIAFALKYKVNAIVVDIKEDTVPGYPSKVMQDYSPTAYGRAANSWDNYKTAIKKIKDAGIYAIGRIVTFKDTYYITDHPESAITSTATGKPYLHNGSYWPSAFVRDVWEYNVKLAVEAVTEMGFNEIQFDYMRFPDRSNTIEKQGLVNMRNAYGESKAQALQTFLMYACDEIHKAGAYVSVDVFGETSNSYVTAYGQYWPAISNVIDAISAMPYPDHFDAGQFGLATPWTQPYTLMKLWATQAAIRQTEIPTPAIARTWIQAYNAIKPPYNEYGATEVGYEIKGLLDGGLTGGFITWNSGSNLDKYNSIATGW